MIDGILLNTKNNTKTANQAWVLLEDDDEDQDREQADYWCSRPPFSSIVRQAEQDGIDDQDLGDCWSDGCVAERTRVRVRVGRPRQCARGVRPCVRSFRWCDNPSLDLFCSSLGSGSLSFAL